MTDTLEPEPPKKKKRKPAILPSSRSLQECRKRGYVAQVVERWNKFAGVRQDLFGVIDIVAIGAEGIIGIQATVGDRHADHRAKVLAEPRAKKWIEAGGKLWLWSWSKRGAANTRKLWTLRAEEITLADFAAASSGSEAAAASAVRVFAGLDRGTPCEICGDRATAVDHSHETGLTRGMLCGACNLALGQFKDDPRLLRRAADYLEAARRLRVA